MIEINVYLLVIPMFAMVLLGITISKMSISSNNVVTSFMEGKTTDNKNTACDNCPNYITEFPCSTAGNSVLGGVDFVQYFVDFQLDDGTYNETQIGIQGDANIYTTYKNFTYNFLTQENKVVFEKKPEKYIPQWGGYCAWGIAGEYCPNYPWSADCLGPSGNWGHWTIIDEKLYFFLYQEAKNKFINENEPDEMINAGDTRWSEWFDTTDEIPMSTSCYVSYS